MNGFRAFLKKEILEYVRTSKFFILLGVFILLGIMSPLFAKLMPQLLSSLVDESMASILSPSEPTALDCYIQFFKNITQLGLIALVLLCSTTLTNELSKGTLIPFLTKGLQRSSVLFSKFLASSILWTLCYGVSFLITWLYTKLLFPDLLLPHLALSVASVWVFGILLIAIVLFASSFLSASYSVLLVCVVFIAVLFMINIVPAVHDVNPILLISDNVVMLTATYETEPIWISMGVSLCIILLSLWVGCCLFQKRRV